jgi:hypothetical protein
MIMNFAQGSDVFCVRLKNISFSNLLLARNYSLYCSYVEHYYTICGIIRANDASAGGCALLSDWLL